ncbi:MAG: ABC transporter permease [Clostridia bacterium]|nr:ABC transporter permease [Clostridia bacterium]
MNRKQKNKRPRSRAGAIWFRFKKNKLALVGVVIIFIMSVLAIFAGVIVDYQADVVEQNAAIRMQPASGDHILGTDSYGRDIFGRIVYGARTSLAVGLSVVGLALIMGGVVGSIAGYFGGTIDIIIMRFMDILLAIPSLILAMAVVSALGTDIKNLTLALAIAHTPQFARVVRAAVMPLRGQEYVESARAFGTKNFRIITRHILPNAFGPIIVQATMQIGTAILNISSLSFIGLGIQSPAPEWGSMLAEAREYLRYEPTLVLAPGICIMLAVFSFNRIGDGLRDALDPRLKN